MANDTLKEEMARAAAAASESEEKPRLKSVGEQRTRDSRPGSRTRKNVPPPSHSSSSPGEFVEMIEGWYFMLGLGLSAIDKHHDDPENPEKITGSCGVVISNAAHDIAIVWDKAAQNNPYLAAQLRRMSGPSIFMDIAMAHAPIVASVMAHHMPKSKPKPAEDGPPKADGGNVYQYPATGTVGN